MASRSRSIAAKQGWETRRARAAAEKRARARRSAAARKGWETRRARQRMAVESRRAMREESQWYELKPREFSVFEAAEFRRFALPTREELYDYLEALSKQYDLPLSALYRMYFGYADVDVN